MELELKTTQEGADLTIALEGELNTQTAPKLKEILDEKLAETNTLHLDFSGCDFVSSAGLRVLLNTYKSLKAKNGTMELLNVGPTFTEVLKITGLGAVFSK